MLRRGAEIIERAAGFICNRPCFVGSPLTITGDIYDINCSESGSQNRSGTAYDPGFSTGCGVWTNIRHSVQRG